MKKGFRYDINLLRVIALVGVVLFHFNPSWMPGGYLGVDVFFVISGFLMSSIIIKGLDSENFNIFSFYLSRANRIIPPLVFLCLTLLVFGWFFIPPLEYKKLSNHIFNSLIFDSNISYWLESGYFDVSSYKKWLLHT